MENISPPEETNITAQEDTSVIETTENKYLSKPLPTDFLGKFTYVIRILIYTYAPVQGMLEANWASQERKKNLKDLDAFFDISKYDFDRMDTEELVDAFVTELVNFIESSVVTQQVNF
jgi:hypothetical protein